MFMKILDRLEEIIISVLMAAATALIFVAVLQRYAAGTKILYPLVHWIDLSWAQELCIYMFVWMAKFGAAYGVRTGIHVGVDVLVNKLPESYRRKTVLLSLAAGAIFTAIIGTLGASLVWALSHTSQSSADLELPMWIVYLAIPCGSYLMCFRFLQTAWRFWRTGELPMHDHAHVEGMEEEIALQAAGVPPVAPAAAGAAR
jgi:C4-dicarboxylate transporter DctQ subunit